MIPLLLNEEILDLETSSIEKSDLSIDKLIDSVGRLVAQFIIEKVNNPFNQNFIIICGPGNNGADAIATHNYLLHYGVNSRLILINENNYLDKFLKNYNIDLSTLIYNIDSYIFDINSYYIDGIFGIGLKRKIKGLYEKIINNLHKCKNIISLDIPSGIYCDTGTSAGCYVKAKFTLTFSYPKLGLYINDGRDASGSVNIIDIGLSKISEQNEYINIINKNDIENKHIQTSKNIHKYNNGRVIMISGAQSYSGATILASKAVINTGVGILKILVPKSIYSIVENSLFEAITIPLEDYNIGFLSDANVESIRKYIPWSDAVLFGPGLVCPDSKWMANILCDISKPLVLDASGFSPIIDRHIEINDLPKNTILTPHYAEFSKLFNIDINDLNINPINILKNIIKDLDSRILILKGPSTFIVTSKGRIFVIVNGSSLLATAGTGDVLSGVICSLISKGYSLDNASIIGTYLHAEASNFYENNYNNNFTASKLSTSIRYNIN